MAYQINTRYNTHARDGACHRISYGLRFVKSTPINDSLKEAFNLTGSFLIGYMEIRHSLLYFMYSQLLKNMDNIKDIQFLQIKLCNKN